MFYVVAVVLFAATEFVIGWWALPVVGFVLGLVGARKRGVGVIVAGAALTAWAMLFAWNAFHGNLGSFMQSLAGSMKLKPTVLIGAVLALPALLAGPAARLGAGLRPDLATHTPSTPA